MKRIFLLIFAIVISLTFLATIFNVLTLNKTQNTILNVSSLLLVILMIFYKKPTRF